LAYPNELEIKDTTESHKPASYLDILLNIDSNDRLTTALYEKRDDVDFEIVKFSSLCSDILHSTVCLFVCFESHEQFFSYLATVTIAGDRAANLDLCLALAAFSSEGSFTCHTYCDTGPPFRKTRDSTF
jgi:hypothetical protein